MNFNEVGRVTEVMFSQLKNNKNKKKVREDNKKVCRLLTKAVMSVIKA